MRTAVQVKRLYVKARRPCGPRYRRAVRANARKVRDTKRETIRTDKAPTPLGAYSQGMKSDKLLFVGGQLGIVPNTGQLISESPAEQTEQAMKNMGAILDAAGTSFDNVMKTTLLLAEIEDFKEVNAVYAKYFKDDPPARVAYSVKGLPLNARVEIDAIALTE